MLTISLSEAKSHFSELSEEVDRTHERVRITKNGHRYVVLMSEEDLDSLEATLELLADPEAQERIRQSVTEIEGGDYLDEEAMRALMAQRYRKPSK